jgi:hypothetical protein
MNPAAPHHLPWFFTAPGETDGLFTAMIVLLIVACLVIGNLFLYLYQLPMQLAGRGRVHKIQAEVIAVLALIALFTGVHLYWILGLLLAFVRLPDLWTPINSMGQSLRQMVTKRRPLILELEPNAEPAQPGNLPPLANELRPQIGSQNRKLPQSSQEHG